jgi:hypothetical protein
MRYDPLVSGRQPGFDLVSSAYRVLMTPPYSVLFINVAIDPNIVTILIHAPRPQRCDSRRCNGVVAVGDTQLTHLNHLTVLRRNLGQVIGVFQFAANLHS